MKRLLLLQALVFTTFFATAQMGNWYLGGIASYNSTSSKSPTGFTTTTSGWAFGPEVGTFLKDDIQLGIYMGLGGSSQKNDNGDISKTSEFSPTVYGRKFFKITDNFSTFAGFYFSYISGTTTSYPGGNANESTSSGIGFRLGVGVAYALSPRFTAVGQYGLLGYESLNYKSNGQDAGSASSFEFGVNTIGYGSSGQGGGVFNIGIYYTIKTN